MQRILFTEESLYECHGHLMMDGEDYAAAKRRHQKESRTPEDGTKSESPAAGSAFQPCPDEKIVRAELAALRDAGVGYFRDGGDSLGVCLLAKNIAGEYGIDYVTPAFAIHKKGRYGGIVGRSFETMAEYRQRIAEVKEEGGDFVKLIVSGIITFKAYGDLSCPALPPEEIREMVHIAHEEGFSVMMHTNGDETIRAAVEAGTDSIEHGYFAGEETLMCLAESKSLWVPTLSAVDAFIGREGFDEGVARETLARQKDAIRTCCKYAEKAGNKAPRIASGSDSGAVGVPHGSGTHREYALLAETGLTQGAILAANRELRQRFSAGVR